MVVRLGWPATQIWLCENVVFHEILAVLILGWRGSNEALCRGYGSLAEHAIP
jgi:hypothetical protein